MRNVWSVYCSQAIIDTESNNVTMIEAIESVGVDIESQDELYSVPMRSSLVSLWVREDPDIPEVGIARSQLISPEGEPLGGWEYEVDLNSTARSRHRGALSTLPIKSAGYYAWVVSEKVGEKWVEVARVPLEVKLNLEAVDSEG